MLKKSERLAVQGFLPRKSRSLYGDHFKLRFFLLPVGSGRRFGVLVGARLFPKATERNKLKRGVFAAIRNFRAAVPEGEYLIIPLKTALKLKPKDRLAALWQVLGNVRR